METENIKTAEQMVPEKVEDILDDVLSIDAIKDAHEANIKMAKDIKTMADDLDGLCACMYDTNNYLKLITGDLITIRKKLTEEDAEKFSVMSYLSNIDQSLKEINARGQNVSQN